ncbi:hypothetical protein GPECTOR_26g468 [Gonium pectorale]|uniref:non-specific serine/threonine protein kinase n=1 Tax=Gonium pectorale TaxID=33097 RepID=A0A150GG38_GONPE|nr:hypothetical protein GPECTOR_26g468 [Gonium pectorale]|eukprot:KXZ48565.1 hypothetical protein GPECTOR_26g468 [Gonium pectorale]
MTFSLWDFGGQDVYYSTHAFFMASRAVYLVMYRSRDDSELDRLQEYMDRIQALAPGAPMVLVGTHAGERTEQGGNFRPKQPPPTLFTAFPSLHREPLFVSSMNGYGVKDLKAVVLQLALRQPGVGELLPASFIKLRRAVQSKQQTFKSGAEPVVTAAQYAELAASAGVDDPTQLRTFTSLLYDFGDLLHFEHVPGLEDAMVLRPQWVADVMAHVITMNDAKLKKMEEHSASDSSGGAMSSSKHGGSTGRVAKSALLQLMEEVSPTRAEGLLALLENFNMMHSIDEVTALVPPMMPDVSSAHGATLLYEEASKSPDAPRFRWWSAHYEYSYVPDALMCRVLCRVFALPNLEILEAWRFGAVMRRNSHLAMILQGTMRGVDRNVVSVVVCGPKPENLGCLVSAKLKDLLAEAFKGVKLEDIRYSCPHCVQARQRQPCVFKAKFLQKKANANEKVTCEVCEAEDLDLADRLDKDDQATPWRPKRARVPATGAAATAARKASGVFPAATDDATGLTVTTAVTQQQGMMVHMVDMLGQIAAKLNADSTARQAEYKDLRALAGARAEGEEDLIRRITAVAKLVAGTDSKPLPTLHVVLPMPSADQPWWDRKGLLKARFRLHLLCEHPGGPHLTDHEGYEIERPAEWLRRYAPGVRLLTHSLGLLLGTGVKALTSGGSDMGLGRLGELVDAHVLNEPLEAFTKLNDLLSSLQQEDKRGREKGQEGGGKGMGMTEEGEEGIKKDPKGKATGGGGKGGGPPPASANGAAASGSTAAWQALHQLDFTNSQEARREIEALVRHKDSTGNYGNLQKIKTRAGDVVWLCKCHSEEHIRNNTCAFLLVSCIVANLIAPPVRKYLRPFILRTVLSQLDFVSQFQQLLRSPLLDVLAKLTAFSVSVEIYLLSLPPIAWLGGASGAAASMAVCQCMAISTYMACVLKDVFCCPRPGPASDTARRLREKAAALSAAGKAPDDSMPMPKPGAGVTAGVEVLEAAYRNEVEMGAPSMHTWCALLMPAYSAAVAMQLGAITPATATTLTAASGVWSIWVALSRLYLGVHTPIDLALGALGGAAALGLWRRLGLAILAVVGEPGVTAAAVSAWDRCAMPAWARAEEGSALGLLAVGAAYLLALRTYPRPMMHTTSYEYAVIFLGAAYGGLVSLSGRVSIAPPLLRALAGGAAAPAAMPQQLRHPAAVVALGFVAVFAVKEASKAVLCAVLPYILGAAPLAVRQLWQPPVHPAGCYRPEEGPVVSATATIEAAVTPDSPAPKAAALASPDDGGKGAAFGREGGSGGRHGEVLMKTARLAYDVDFARKWVNYGITVYAAMEFRHVAAALMAAGQ